MRSRLDQIVDLAHPLAKFARGIDWSFLEQQLGAVYTDGPERPPLATHARSALGHQCGLTGFDALGPREVCLVKPLMPSKALEIVGPLLQR